MKGIEHIRRAYFAGIGGIGMSALAKLLHHRGVAVCGYDRVRTPLTENMEQMGINIHYTDDNSAIADFISNGKEDAIVVITPAIPAGFGEVKTLLNAGFFPVKRAELLGMISESYRCMAVAGTHGKTTTSSMLAWLMQAHPHGSGAVLGGIATNFNENLVIPTPQAAWLITEADEYDRSFLHLNPEIAIITSTDADHLDIYQSHDQLLKAFNDFAAGVKEGGYMLLRKGLEVKIPANVKTYTYGSPEADFFAADQEISGITHCFNLYGPGLKLEDLKLNMPGSHNVENAVAACAAAWLSGLSPESIRAQLATFNGVKRRFEYIIHTPGFVFIDDYAHHPREIEALISSVKDIYPQQKITAVFQPHLYTRTRDFAEGFAKSLSLADEVIMLDIYPARELPMEGVNSSMILDNVVAERKYLCSKAELPELVKSLHPQVLLTIGAGDIDRQVEILKNELLKKGEQA